MPLEARLLIGLATALAVVHAHDTAGDPGRRAVRVLRHGRSATRATRRPRRTSAARPWSRGSSSRSLLLGGDWDRSLPLLGGRASCCGWSGRSTTAGRSRRSRGSSSRSALAAGLWALGLGWELGAGPVVDLAVSVVWIVAVVNAFNLFDNMDGAASSMAAVVAGGLALLGVVEGNTWLAVTGAALCGAAVGFLPHNLLASPGADLPRRRRQHAGRVRRRRGDDDRRRATRRRRGSRSRWACCSSASRRSTRRS